MFQLDQSTGIGLGHCRTCYAYPEEPDLCIKVARRANGAGCNDQNTVEWRNFRGLARRRVPLRHVAKCYGWVATTQGPGLVCERIRNADGRCARTLDRSLAHGEVEWPQVLAMLLELRHWSVVFSVVVSDLRSTNLMVRHQQDGVQLVFIDGLGGRKMGRNFLIRQNMRWLARMKTRRQWRKQGPATYGALEAVNRERLAHRR